MSQLFTWGGNQSGQLGIGSLEKTKVDRPVPIQALKNEEVVDIACGESHMLILLKDGKAFSCGNNDYGQLGRQNRVSRLEQIDALQNQTVTKAQAGLSHSLVLTCAGEMFSWGENLNGQLGRGDVPTELGRVPKLIKFPHTVVQISCGRNHNLCVIDDGRIFSWGDNKFGQLGLGSTTQHDNPQLITCLQGIPMSQIACGGSHSFILSQSGAIFGWGRNCFGQLGLNDEKDRPHPTLCKSLRTRKVTYITCGEDHSAALTHDGGLFTFGAGTYGQLGHGTKTNEVLPRQVMELMGSFVTQISSGRCHTLAYVCGNGRLYSFGSGANGQLGNGCSDMKNLPVPIDGSFVPYQPHTSEENKAFVINRISAGGDSCTIWATAAEKEVAPLDFRESDPKEQIKSITPQLIGRICQLSASDKLSVELEDEITKVFSSASCINSSFLLRGEDKFGCTSKKHCVDISSMQKVFGKLADVSHIGCTKKLLQSIENVLLPTLPTSPPDFEALRLYLILPMLHIFEQPKYYRSLIDPFGKSIINLDKLASRVLDLWLATLNASSFLKFITIFKETVSYILQLPDPHGFKEMEVRFHALFVCLEVLKKLNNVNEQNGQMIPYHKFYVPDLKDRVNLKGDYVNWVQRQNAGQFAQGETLLFCNYPFTFDAAAKSLLLQTDALMQMQSAIDEVQRRNILSLFSPINPQSPCLVFHVSRDNIVNDTIQQLVHQGSADLKKPLKVIFIGEEAQDEGGVRKEFFMLLLRELLDPKYGMFTTDEKSRMQWFSSFALEDSSMYLLIGCLCGLAIYNSILIQLNFPLALFKKLLNRTPGLDDLKEYMPMVGKSLEDLLSYQHDDFEDIFSLNFQISQEVFGETKTLDLVEGGSKKSVNKENRKEFVDLYVDYIFTKSVDMQFNDFNKGFHKVCGGRVLELFHPQELKAMVIGNENYDFHELEKNTEYKGDYHRYHQTIQYFWDVFHDMTLADKKKYLLFLTGSDKIPITGMKHVRMVIQPMNCPESFLPVAHTCFNLLDLPNYSSKPIMKDKLFKAIQQTEGFGLV